jgi:hypothetical protein
MKHSIDLLMLIIKDLRCDTDIVIPLNLRAFSIVFCAVDFDQDFDVVYSFLKPIVHAQSFGKLLKAAALKKNLYMTTNARNKVDEHRASWCGRTAQSVAHWKKTWKEMQSANGINSFSVSSDMPISRNAVKEVTRKNGANKQWESAIAHIKSGLQQLKQPIAQVARASPSSPVPAPPPQHAAVTTTASNATAVVTASSSPAHLSRPSPILFTASSSTEEEIEPLATAAAAQQTATPYVAATTMSEDRSSAEPESVPVRLAASTVGPCEPNYCIADQQYFALQLSEEVLKMPRCLNCLNPWHVEVRMNGSVSNLTGSCKQCKTTAPWVIRSSQQATTSGYGTRDTSTQFNRKRNKVNTQWDVNVRVASAAMYSGSNQGVVRKFMGHAGIACPTSKTIRKHWRLQRKIITLRSEKERSNYRQELSEAILKEVADKNYKEDSRMFVACKSAPGGKIAVINCACDGCGFKRSYKCR